MHKCVYNTHITYICSYQFIGEEFLTLVMATYATYVRTMMMIRFMINVAFMQQANRVRIEFVEIPPNKLAACIARVIHLLHIHVLILYCMLCT